MRILLFLGTNFAVLIVFSITARVLGLDRFIEESGGINFSALLLFSVLFGMGGAMVSLALSKTMAKASMRVRIVGKPRSHMEHWLLGTVARQAAAVGLRCPQVGIFPSGSLNAFATGMFRNDALVAVSEGLLQQMKGDEIEAVLAHEVSHIANGDMVTLSLLQGVINTFVIFLSRIVGIVVDKTIFKSRGYGPGYFITSIIAQIVLSVLASMVVMWFSRHREFRADEAGSRLAGRDKMVAALRRLQSQKTVSQLPRSMAAFGISGGVSSGLRSLFMSHPPLEKRIQRLLSLPA